LHRKGDDVILTLMTGFLRASLTAASALLLLATAYLTASLVILDPPGANFRVWFALAAIFVAQSVLTLAAVRMEHPDGLRAPVLAGACCLIALAVWLVRRTLTSSHFEGYNLLLGAIVVAQGILTLAAFARGTTGSAPSTLSGSR
jgi:hypothetical protein